MREATRRAVFERLVRAVRDGDELSGRSTVLSTDRYTDPGQLARELDTLFRSAPVVIAHVSELGERGAWLSGRMGRVPVLVVRGDDRIRVFVNSCRHRGAELVAGGGRGCAKAFTCRYHAWSYRLDGSLLHVPAETAFSALDRDALGLIELACEVRHGFVWARVDGAIDVAGFLGEDVDADWRAFGLDRYRVVCTRFHRRRANWKLVMDAFAEGYHLSSLHRKSLARFFHDAAILDDFAPHVRQVGARRTLPDRYEAFDLFAHTTVFYNVFPSSILVFHPDWLTHLALVPRAVDEVEVVHRMLVAGDASTDAEAVARRDNSFAHIDEHVFQAEDLDVSESIQRSLSAGVTPEMTLGAREEGMRLFHAARDRWLTPR